MRVRCVTVLALLSLLLLLIPAAVGPSAQAAGGAGPGDPSQDPLAAPQEFAAVSGNCHVRLTWKPPASRPEPVIFLNVYRWPGADPSGEPEFLTRLDPSAEDYLDFAVVNDQTYTYEVRAQYDNKVESPATPAAGATPRAAGLSVVLRLGQTAAWVNGAEVVLDTPAQIVGGSTMVPLRFVASSLGAAVMYDSGPQQITAILGARVVRLWIGRPEAEVDGQTQPIAAPPCLIQGRTMVPVRFVSEAFGAAVAYFADESKVTVDLADDDAALEQSTPLAIGVPAVAALNGSNDVDYFRLQTSPGETYVARTHGLGPDCDTVLAQVTENGVELFSDDASYDVKSSELQIVQYGQDAFLYFRVQSAAPGGDRPAGNYSLTVERRAVNPLQAIELLLLGQAHDSELLSPSDIEYYGFSAVAGQTYHVTTENLPPAGGAGGTAGSADTAVWLFEVFGDNLLLVDADDDSNAVPADPYAAALYYTAQQSGPCYVLVNSRRGEPGRYRIKVDSVAAPQPPGPATAHGTAVDHHAWQEWMESAESEDWFSFEAAAGVRYWLSTYNLGPLGDTVLTLIDRDGRTELARNDDAPGRVLGSLVDWVAPSDGRYYVRITPYQAWLGGYVFCVTTTGPEYDHFDYRQAQPVAPDGETQAGSLVEGDYDWFVVTASKGVTYTVETLDLAPGCDTYLVVVTESGDLLGENDDIDYDGGDFASRVTWTAAADGQIYVLVRPRADGLEAGTGVYRLKLTTSAEGVNL